MKKTNARQGLFPIHPAGNNSRSLAMTHTIRSLMMLAMVVSLAGAMCFAQSGGQATYTTKCQMCHGAAGVPSPGMAKAMGVKPVTDPAIKALTVEQMIAAVKNGKGKMKPITGLTDEQIKAAVVYYRSLKG
jgi:mono/diheme cytochrome c family protein